MTRPSVYVNDFNLEVIGFTTERVDGLDDAAEMALPTGVIPGRAGVLPLSTLPTVEPRTVTVTGTLQATTTALLASRLTQLAGLCGAGLVQLRTVRTPDKLVEGRLKGFTEVTYSPQYRRTFTRVVLTFLCTDPMRRDVSPLLIAIAATPTTVVLGTAPSAPILLLKGGTNPVVTLRHPSGLVLATMGFSITLAATDYLTVDCRNGTITKSLSGVVTNAYDTWTTKSDGFFVLDPHDGDPVLGTAQTLEVSGGGVADAYLWRQWR